VRGDQPWSSGVVGVVVVGGGGVDALDHHELQEADTVVGVAVAERVLAVGVGRWVRAAVERREGQGLEPGGAGLGQAGEEDVRWVWLELEARRGASGSGCHALEQELGFPEAPVQAMGHREPCLQGQRVDDLGCR